MALVAWDSSYSVKVSKCDKDHQQLFSLLNDLHDAMLVGKGSQVVERVISELADYTKFHFEREEALLEKTNYAALAEHRAEHRTFVEKVERFQQDLKAGDMSQAIPIATFIKDWLVNHIKRTDFKYSAHLNAKGVS